jgi:hypothetical protein
MTGEEARNLLAVRMEEKRIKRLWPEAYTRVVSTSRNLVLGERFDSRTYLLPSGRTVKVRTLCEMEFVPKGKV